MATEAGTAAVREITPLLMEGTGQATGKVEATDPDGKEAKNGTDGTLVPGTDQEIVIPEDGVAHATDRVIGADHGTNSEEARADWKRKSINWQRPWNEG